MKNELSCRTSLRCELPGSPDIIAPAALAEFPETEDERKNRELCWRSQLPVRPTGFTDELVELVVLPSDDSPQLLGFMSNLSERLQDYDNYGSIMRTAYSSIGHIIVDVLMLPDKVGSLVIKLANMPEVEKVWDEPQASGVLSSFLNKSANSPMSNMRPGKKVFVALEDTGLAKHRLSAC